MRLSLTLIFLAILITFSSSYFLLSQTASNTLVRNDPHQVNDFKKYFYDNYGAVQKIDLSKIYAKTDASSLVDPAYKLYHTHVYSYELMQFFLELKNFCRDNTSNQDFPKTIEDKIQTLFEMNAQSLKDTKALLKFFAYINAVDCKAQDSKISFKFENKNPTLSIAIEESITASNFAYSKLFEEIEPYMHPFGNSFALMALLAFPESIPAQEKTNWAQNHLSYFHAQELSLLNSFGVNLPLEFEVLADLSKEGLQALSNQQEIILSKNYVLIHNDNDNYASNSQFSSYLAYKISSFEKALNEKFPYLKAEENTHLKSCLVEESNICWYQDSDKLFSFLKRYTLVFFGTSILVVFMMVFTVFRRIAEEKREEEKKRFALQTLTHELRTPLASMSLALENLRPAFDKLNASEQSVFGHILSDSARLLRLAEASRQYLSLERSKHFITLKPVLISSFNEFLESALDMFLEQIEIDYLVKDLSVTIDGYWLAICIKNLVDNALEHGAKPVRVIVKSLNGEISISVEDQGVCEFSNIKQMKSAFVKNNKSQGLGLGLTLVAQILKDMGGHLDFFAPPTTFVLTIPVQTPTTA